MNPTMTRQIARKWQRRKATTKAANFTLSHRDHGKAFIIDAADVVATLPRATKPGIRFSFIVKTLSSSTGFKIAPHASDAILRTTTTANKYYLNTAATDAIGDMVTLESDGNGNWLITSQVGTWAKES